MSEVLASHLFQSEARTRVLELLFARRVAASVSELARQAELSPRAVAREVHHLLPTGLLAVESQGAVDLVRANLKHPATRPLLALLATPARAGTDEKSALQVRESLAAWGAPLASRHSAPTLPLNEALLLGLEHARRDGTLLRVLPTVLARNAADMDWSELKKLARQRKLKAELGMLLELTGHLLGRDELAAQSLELRDRRRRTMRFFPEARSPYEKELAKRRSPEVARAWGFWMNMSEESFRATLGRHVA